MEGDMLPGDVETTQRPSHDHDWIDGAWVLSLAAAQTTQLAALASYRWGKQSGGTTGNGASIKTDSDSLTLINGAKALVDALGASATVNFKTGAGAFVTLTQAQVNAIALAVGQHVQLCFNNEAAHATAVMTMTDPSAVMAYDFTTGWPE